MFREGLQNPKTPKFHINEINKLRVTELGKSGFCRPSLDENSHENKKIQAQIAIKFDSSINRRQLGDILMRSLAPLGRCRNWSCAIPCRSMA
jgi:hypothetical protein